MLPEEARWLGEHLSSIEVSRLSPMLNIGSSTGRFVTRAQPWIDEFVFAPLRARGVRVLNSDLKAAPGVDLVGDLEDPRFLEELSRQEFKSLLCSNLLEHVRSPARIARTLAGAVVPGGYLFVTGPYRYPFHPDPIDTLFRPDVEELSALFPETQTLAGQIVSCGTYWDYVSRSRTKLLTTVVRLGMPFYKPKDWVSAALRVPWLGRQFQTVCLMLQRGELLQQAAPHPSNFSNPSERSVR